MSPGAGGRDQLLPLESRCEKVVRSAIRPTHELTTGYRGPKNEQTLEQRKIMSIRFYATPKSGRFVFSRYFAF